MKQADIVVDLYRQKMKPQILQAMPFWIASLITGLVAVLYAKMFAVCENYSLLLVHGHDWILFFLTPACFVTAWWLVSHFEKKAAGSGIPQVMASIELATPKYNHLVDKFLSFRIILVKIVSSLFMVIGGGAIGREGPTVQIAGSIFRMVNQLLPASWPKVSKKNMIITGAAAGLAAAFNTPLGGIVFAVEELARSHISYFKTAIFTAVIIAGLTAQGILGPYLYLGYPDVSNTTLIVFLYVVLVAIIAGALGSFLSVIIMRLMKWKRTFKHTRMHVFYVLISGLIFATIAFFIGHGILGSGKEQMADLLFRPDKHVAWSLPLLRLAGPAICFTTGGAGGVFAPALSAGAVVGGMVGELTRLSGVDVNILILAGMVAFLTGVTRSPFTSAILVLEMTDRHNVIFHLMLAGMIASIAAMVIDPHSLYDRLKDMYLSDAYHEDIEAGKRQAEVSE